MSKRLVIAEKPSVAVDLAKALGPHETNDDGDWYETPGFVISFAMGHLLELVSPENYKPEWKNWSLKQLPIIPDHFEHTPRDKKAASRLKLLKKLASRQDVVGIVNACDAGREGEHIFRTILHEIGSDLPVQRLWLSSLTQAAIRKGFERLQDAADYASLGAAAACRAEADWLIGMNATRALTGRLRSLSYDGAWSAGRVQTPTLTMCVEREMEILQHRPRTYWELSATFEASDHTYDANYQLPPDLVAEDEPRTRIFDRAHMEKLAVHMAANDTGTASETRSKRAEKPPVPYDLTSLQRATGLTARRTQDVAQALYERHKLLSYPRTDSRHLPTEERPMLEQRLSLLQGMPELTDVVTQIRDVGAMNMDRVFDDSRVTDHHAIIPVGVPRPGQLEDTELRVYMMVARHFLASLMPPAQWEHVVRETVVQVDDHKHLFRSTGRMLLVPGWQFAMGRSAGHGSSLQELNPNSGAAVTLKGHEFAENLTKPRGRLTDATLLSKMENCGKEIEDVDISEALRERGLGTPATRADTIERLIDRGYLVRGDRALRATAKAVRLVEVLRRAGAIRLISAELTGAMEYKLRNVEGGDLTRDTYMDSVVGNTKELVDTLVGFRFDDMYADSDDVGTVPGRPTVPVRETAWGYSTDEETSPEPFFIWKDVGGRVLLPPEMRRMLESEDGSIGPVTLYPQGSGNRPGYEANLVLRRLTDSEHQSLAKRKSGKAPSRWTVDIQPLEAMSWAQVDDTPEDLIGDFLTTEAGLKIVETTVRWVDAEHLEGANRPKGVLPKVVCQRDISSEEAQLFFTEGTTGFLENFISKRGRPFRAKLILKSNGRHGFEFEARRKGRGKKRKAADGEEAEASTSGGTANT